MGDIKYPELYNIFSEWAEYMKATRKRKLVVRLWVCFGVTFLLGLFLGCFFSNATRMICGSIMALGLFISFIKDLFLLSRIEKNDEDIDKYINMASANAKRYYLVPNDTASIMQVVGDIDVDYFELIEESIKRGICFGSPFVYVTTVSPVETNLLSIPVLSLIHSSEVSTNSCKSKLVTFFSGRALPVPAIFILMRLIPPQIF